MLKKGVKSFEEGMTVKKYMRITQTSKATVTRDLKTLEKLEAFIVKGDGRSSSYELNFKFNTYL